MDFVIYSFKIRQNFSNKLIFDSQRTKFRLSTAAYLNPKCSLKILKNWFVNFSFSLERMNKLDSLFNLPVLAPLFTFSHKESWNMYVFVTKIFFSFLDTHNVHFILCSFQNFYLFLFCFHNGVQTQQKNIEATVSRRQKKG